MLFDNEIANYSIREHGLQLLCIFNRTRQFLKMIVAIIAIRDYQCLLRIWHDLDRQLLLRWNLHLPHAQPEASEVVTDERVLILRAAS